MCNDNKESTLIVFRMLWHTLRTNMISLCMGWWIIIRCSQVTKKKPSIQRCMVARTGTAVPQFHQFILAIKKPFWPRRPELDSQNKLLKLMRCALFSELVSAIFWTLFFLECMRFVFFSATVTASFFGKRHVQLLHCNIVAYWYCPCFEKVYHNAISLISHPQRVFQMLGGTPMAIKPPRRRGLPSD